jgi:hypothetical protein
MVCELDVRGRYTHTSTHHCGSHCTSIRFFRHTRTRTNVQNAQERTEGEQKLRRADTDRVGGRGLSSEDKAFAADHRGDTRWIAPGQPDTISKSPPPPSLSLSLPNPNTTAAAQTGTKANQRHDQPHRSVVGWDWVLRGPWRGRVYSTVPPPAGRLTGMTAHKKSEFRIPSFRRAQAPHHLSSSAWPHLSTHSRRASVA